MYVEASGIAKFKVNATGEEIIVNAADLCWECEGTGDERQMGAELVHSAEYSIECNSGKSYEITWSIWEYPVGAENTKDTNVPDGVFLVEDIRYCLSHEPDQDE